MEIFLDSANHDEIREIKKLGFLDGITTNPSLMAKENLSLEDSIRGILALCDGPVSLEVLSTTLSEMIDEGEKLAKLGEQVVVKLPTTWDGLKVCQHLTSKRIPTNLTLCFSASQALLAAKAGATYISPFIGRIDDISNNGIALITQIRKIYDLHNFKTKILAASIRHPLHFLDSALEGAHCATIPYGILKSLIKHPLTDIGLDKFTQDSKKISKNNWL